MVFALAELAPDPQTEPGRYFACRPHGQMVVWDGRQWRWSDHPEDIEQLPPMAECKTPAQPRD